MENDSYQRLAQVLDTIPNGYPSTDSGVELRILQKLFTPQEAELATHLHLTWETADEIAARVELVRDREDGLRTRAGECGPLCGGCDGHLVTPSSLTDS